jgi:hypothetical protein
MGAVSPSRPVTPIVAVLWREQRWLAEAESRLIAAFGAIALTSPAWPFHWSDYYTHEMGTGLTRRFYTFAPLVDPADLARLKLATNAAGTPGRPVNLDAGYITGSKLVLASTKDGPARIAVGSSIFAEITLSFTKGAWHPHEYTYPDYRSGEYFPFLLQARELHLTALNHR